MNVIKLFYLKVGLLFRHVSVFSWFDLLWFKRFAKRGVVTEKEKVMTMVMKQCYQQIDRGVKFKDVDLLDENAVRLTQETTMEIMGGFDWMQHWCFQQQKMISEFFIKNNVEGDHQHLYVHMFPLWRTFLRLLRVFQLEPF